jgi:hypothetical protein
MSLEGVAQGQSVELDRELRELGEAILPELLGPGGFDFGYGLSDQADR